jgi:hypothetical protein
VGGGVEEEVDGLRLGRALVGRELDRIDAKESVVLAQPDERLEARETLVGATLYVPVSSTEEALATNPKYSCCSFRGSVVALEAATGKVL